MIGGFGILTFEVSEDNIKSIDGQLSRTLTAKISEHNAINGIGMHAAERPRMPATRKSNNQLQGHHEEWSLQFFACSHIRLRIT